MVQVSVRRTAVIALAFMALSIPMILGASCIPLPITPTGNNNGGDNGGGPTTQPAADKYVGAETCKQCHLNVHNDWSKTLHASAMQTLADAGQADNPACVGCHSVGYGDGGFVDNATTPQLANVQCESCHGPAWQHVHNVDDKTLRPTVNISADVCGKCHTGAHHPTYDDWKTSPHATVVPDVASYFTAGKNLNTCGPCHSGDFRYQSLILGNTVADTFLQGVAPDKMNAVTCVVCHEPHAQTGKAAHPEAGRDYQLRYPEVASPAPSNVVADIMNADRYNVCGQCHHSREADWTATSRGPHHSVQASVYIGEMPMPAGQQPLVPNQQSVHAFVPEQCATCHVHREPGQGTQDNPTVSGHTFAVNTKGCSAAGCHPSEDVAKSTLAAVQTEMQTALDAIHTRLGDPATWEYSTSGGPSDQTTVSDTIKQVRFMYYYLANDGSLGAHNPEYYRLIINKCDDLLTSAGK